MKLSVSGSCASVLSVLGIVAAFSAGCGSDKPPANGGGTGTAGTPGAAGAAHVAGASGAGAPGAAGNPTVAGAGGAPGTAGAPATAGAGGAPVTAGAGGTPGAAGSAGGGTAGGASTGFQCPAGPYSTFTAPTAKATKIAGAPPNDTFNMNNWTNVEGPVWIGDSLYFSEMTNGNMRPPARILKIGPGNVVSIAVAMSGSNGLAVDSAGNLIAAVHGDGSIDQIALPSGTPTPIVSMYNNAPFNSPNDLTIRSDGTIYFSDPTFQNTANPQKAQRLYRVAPAPTRTISVVDGAPSSPNGVTLSPDEKTLYVTGGGFKKFAVMSDGSLDGGAPFVTGNDGDGDGMVVDCAGNLYVAGNNTMVVRVYSPAAALLATIQLDNSGVTTNVAFGGSDHKTLYITAQGTEGQRGVWSIALPIPGFPY